MFTFGQRRKLIALKEVELFKREELIKGKEEKLLDNKMLDDKTREVRLKEIALEARVEKLNKEHEVRMALLQDQIKLAQTSAQTEAHRVIIEKTGDLRKEILAAKDKEIDMLKSLLSEAISALRSALPVQNVLPVQK